MIAGMPLPKIAPLHADLDFNSPLSDARVERILRTLQPLDGARVVDVGCGWAELLLRIAAAHGSVSAVGIDTDRAAIEHGRANAAARGLTDRVELHVEQARQWAAPAADVAICVGASHAWGGTADALDALRAMVRPGGRILLGEGFWLRAPTDAAMAALGGDPEEFGSLADLVDLAVAHGLRPLAVSQASTDEWDAFESGYALARERWLLAHPDDPQAQRIRAEADEHRRRWLRGYRGVLGFAYLTLTPAVAHTQ
jgi:SAM-dependent methyltransferase